MPPLIVTAAIIEEQGRFLVTRRPDDCRHAGLWEFPGGKLEDGEAPEQALIRELREELDLDIEVAGIVDVLHHRYDWGAILLLAYRARILGGRIRHLGVAEHRWVRPDEMLALPFLPADAPLVRKLAGT
ncbi:8-oxo-dGTP diphosphatase [Geothermobacter ehrlichii]|uniref:8-oxo-dGTP diphosphatase n=1 Tax=Geothermobacter ehrlichii TaxID=213224 RepID=A0A5D3WLE4_9BACT|nr:(deoxy)nucleoside triphosphate pyrophosphohydrolase [Geothermobacter ehrlichii]TYO98323.1 8-oxo-dGTP diphosphatase [Geothermobacter ehrlichii]